VPAGPGEIDNRSMQRRRDHRYEVWESVVISIGDAAEARHQAATMVDVSKSGYRVLSGIPLEPGTEIVTTLHSVAIIGVVRHCEPTVNNAFTAGVEITQVVAEEATAALSFEPKLSHGFDVIGLREQVHQRQATDAVAGQGREVAG
jgi:hypothetical protein